MFKRLLILFGIFLLMGCQTITETENNCSEETKKQEQKNWCTPEIQEHIIFDDNQVHCKLASKTIEFIKQKNSKLEITYLHVYSENNYQNYYRTFCYVVYKEKPWGEKYYANIWFNKNFEIIRLNDNDLTEEK